MSRLASDWHGDFIPGGPVLNTQASKAARIDNKIYGKLNGFNQRVVSNCNFLSWEARAMKEDNDRYKRGLAKLAEMDPQVAQRVADSLADVAPDFARYVVEFPFGDIFSRPGLDLRTRELITIAALTAIGHAQPQLKGHIQLAIKAGCSREEITETIMQMAVYAGFPAALNGLFLARAVFSEEEINQS